MISGGFDKAKSCYGCPDRWVKDGHRCHESCKEYLERTRKHEEFLAEVRSQKAPQNDADAFVAHSIRRVIGRRRKR